MSSRRTAPTRRCSGSSASSQFDHAVVAIGANLEASVLTVLALAEAGVPDIWAKAITTKHGRILERVGAHHVVYPEQDMGERVARVLAGAGPPVSL